MEKKNFEQVKIFPQTACCFWLTGLSGAGKSVLSESLLQFLDNQQIFAMGLDGDKMRHVVSSDLGFSMADRMENVRRTVALAAWFLERGITVVVALMSPLEEMRIYAKTQLGEKRFYEIYISATLQTCIQRDTKGLYAKALRGELQGMIGLDLPFEAPKNPFLCLETDKFSEEDCKKQLFDAILPEILNKTS